MADEGRRDAVPLLVFCALGLELRALRGGLPGGRDTPAGGPPTGPRGPVVVVRSGMGPRAAERVTARVLGRPPGTAGCAVVAAGFCAGLAPGMRPGDVVVAAETRGPHGAVRCRGVARLATGLAARLGGRGAVHVGPLALSDRLVRGAAQRAALHGDGAIAVDMESAVTLRTAVRMGRRPVAAVRVVVDAPGCELLRIGTLRHGTSAFRALRMIMPVLDDWRRSQMLPRR